jgi:cytochrome c oxidase cbb3-type subunit III
VELYVVHFGHVRKGVIVSEAPNCSKRQIALGNVISCPGNLRLTRLDGENTLSCGLAAQNGYFGHCGRLIWRRSLIFLRSIAIVTLGLAALTPSLPARQATPPPTAPQQGAQAPAGRGGRGGVPEYPPHAQADPATIAQGQQIFGANCAFCHGSDARGGEGGPNLLRSQVVLNDQNGEAISAVVLNGRADLGMPKFDFTPQQMSDIVGFLHSLSVTGRDPSRDIPVNIVVGDAKAGEAFFNGAGKCSTCHSVTGDLAGIGGKVDAKTLQNAVVSGNGGRGRGLPPVPPTMVKVTLPSGKVVEGRLERVDDFLVTLTDSDGNRLTFKRNGDVPRVEIKNPLQAHLDMLPKYTDDEMHNLTAYLVTLK